MVEVPVRLQGRAQHARARHVGYSKRRPRLETGEPVGHARLFGPHVEKPQVFHAHHGGHDIGIGQRKMLPGQPGSVRQPLFHARKRLLQTFQRGLDVLVGKSGAPHALIEMFSQGKALSVFKELCIAHVAPDRHEIGVERWHADRRHRHLLDVLAPGAQACPAERIVGTQWRTRKYLVEIFVDRRRLDDHLAVVHQGGHDAIWIELEVFGRQVVIVVELYVA